MRRHKPILYFFTACILAAFVLEFLLSGLFMVKDRNVEAMDVVDAPYLYYRFNASEGTNADGFKTPYGLAKDDSTYRIALVGGSVCRGQGDPDSSIAGQLQRLLRRSLASDRVDVVNAGMSAYGVQQEFLLIQLRLFDYQPDMILGIDGFNDLYAFRLNSPPRAGYGLPPQNWRDLQPIAMERSRTGWGSRLRAVFRNTLRALSFAKSKLEKEAAPTPAEQQGFVEEYMRRLKDTKDFCRSKGVRYFNFLQPLRDFDAGPDRFIFQDPVLNETYTSMRQALDDCSFCFDLTQAMHSAEQHYTDFCHVDYRGNQIIADAIQEQLLVLLRQDAKAATITGAPPVR